MKTAKTYLTGITLFLLLCVDLVAQEGPKVVPGTRDSKRNNQLALDVGRVYAFSLSYARRIRDTNLLFGFGVGGAWEENSHTFSKNIWNVLHAELFARYQHFDFFHLDLGATLLGFSPHDDDERRGDFIGGYVAAMFGYRYVFGGLNVRFGEAEDYRGSESGIILSPVLRIVIPW